MKNCKDLNPEIILDLGGSSDPEKIVYSTYDCCTKQHDYCGTNGCALDIFDDKGEYALGYIAKDDWYIRPVNVVGQKPTFELVVPLANGDLRIIKVENNKIIENINASFLIQNNIKKFIKINEMIFLSSNDF